jgi:uncharacterized membrane protein YkvI
MINKFMDWCFEVEPEWAGFVVCIVVVSLFSTLGLSALLAIAVLTQGYIFLALLLPVLYAFYLAIFKQGGD